MADAFPLSGQIDPRSFPFLINQLHLSGATGSLKVDGPSYQKALYFRGGRVLFGSSNDPRDQLGAILIEAGKITPEQLEDVNAKVGPGNPLAKVLADTGYVSQRELSDAARAKVERILSDLIAYTAGSFEFEDGVLPKGAVDLKLSTPRVMVAAIRRITDRAFVLRHLESLETVLAPRPTLAEQGAEIQAETGGLAPQLDGRRSLKDAAASTRLDEFEAAKIGCALLFLGYVERQAAAAPETMVGADEIAPFSFDEPAAESAPEPNYATDATQILTSPPRFDLETEPSPAAPAETAPEPEPFRFEDPAAFAPPPAEPEAQPAAPRPGDEPTVMFDREDAPFDMSVDPDAAPPAFAAEPEAEPAFGGEPEAPVFAAEAEPVAFEAEPEPELPPTVMMTAPDVPAFMPDTPPEPEPAPEPAETAPPTARGARPSKEDQAALDALLNPTSAAPLRPLSETSAAHSRTDARYPGIRYPAPRPRSRKPFFLAIGAAAVVLVAAVLAWLMYTDAGPETAYTPPSAPPVTQPASTPTPGVSSVSPVPLPSPAQVGAGSAAPPSAAPATVPTAAPATPAPKATPTPARPAPAGGVEGARAALQAGRLDEAARGFASAVGSAPAGSSTLQLLVACSGETVQKAVAAGSAAELIVVPVQLKGRPCYRVTWGLYPSATAAAAAAGTVPVYFRNEGVRPRVVTTSEISR